MHSFISSSVTNCFDIDNCCHSVEIVLTVITNNVIDPPPPNFRTQNASQTLGAGLVDMLLQ